MNPLPNNFALTVRAGCLLVLTQLVMATLVQAGETLPDVLQNEALKPADLQLYQIVDKHIEAVGGLVVMDEIQSLYQTGYLERDGERVGKITVARKKPRSIKIAVKALNDAEVVFGYDGYNAWTTTPTMPQGEAAFMDEKDARRFQQDAFLFSALHRSVHKNFELKLRGMNRVAGIRCYVIDAILPNGDIRRHYIERATFLIRKRRDVLQLADSVFVYDDIYSDYRPVKGIMLPHRIIWRTPDAKILTLHVEASKINHGLFDEIFWMPGNPPPRVQNHEKNLNAGAESETPPPVKLTAPEPQ